MKKLLVLSDSHGCSDLLCLAAKFASPDIIIHLGDVTEDSMYLAEYCFHLPVIRLRGNCDYGADLPQFYTDCVEGVNIFACHGHQYHVKYGLTALSYASIERNARLCLFGHTHVRCLEEQGGVLLLNPGACSGTVPSCALVSLDRGGINVSYLRFDKNGWCFI